MEKKLWIVVFCLILLLVACGPSDNYGFPSKISFGREGGTKYCSGKQAIAGISISDYNGNGDTKFSEGENDTIITTCSWLKVKFRMLHGNEIKIIAEPNTTGKKRTLYVYGSVDNYDATIKVTQSK